MTLSMRIAVADDEPLMRQFFEDCLVRMGHQVVGLAKTGRELIDLCERLEPDLVVTDVRMPDLDGLDAVDVIYQRRPIPIIVVSAFHEAKLIDRAKSNHVLAYLIKPIKEEDLAATIAIASERFDEFQTLRKEADTLRQAIEDRKIIERAKGILMKQRDMDEGAAFRQLQHIARSQSVKMVHVAKVILATGETCT